VAKGRVIFDYARARTAVAKKVYDRENRNDKYRFSRLARECRDY
jgi:hypothetical protein